VPGEGGNTESIVAPETLSAAIDGRISAGDLLVGFAGAGLGNAIGGVVIVALLNYGQVHGQTIEGDGSVP
jgi:hypothetical protein